jgi:hypothetical protein
MRRREEKWRIKTEKEGNFHVVIRVLSQSTKSFFSRGLESERVKT